MSGGEGVCFPISVHATPPDLNTAFSALVFARAKSIYSPEGW
jgi:hypothetical protein